MDINFKFSHIYQSYLSKTEPLSNAEMAGHIKGINEFWNANHISIEASLKEITGLTFKEKKIPCYLNMDYSFSDPLSIRIQEPEKMKETLIHELIHVLFTQNNIKNKKFQNKWNKYWDDFKDEPRLVKSHILVHAVHNLLTGQKRDSVKAEYVRSWEIVEKEGAQNLVDKYLK